jgi:cytochrome c553
LKNIFKEETMRFKKVLTILIIFLFNGLFIGGFAFAQNIKAEWEKSKHAHKELAIQDATWEGRKENAAHCARCHSEQGFKTWVVQLMKGDPSFIKKPDGSKVDKTDEAFIKGLGLTRDKVKPVTCEACHSKGAELRIKDNIPMLPNGISIRAMGKGALCMACHNTRNGRINWDNPDPKRYVQPHESAQSDVILGKNVYFLNDTLFTESPHAIATGNSCVTCHKELGKGGHIFKAGDCITCHGPKMKASFVQSSTQELLNQLAKAIEKKILASKDRIACVTSWDPKTDKDTPNTPIDGRQIKAVEIPMGIHGQISLKFIMEDGKVIYSQMGNIKDAFGEQGKPVFATSDPIVRALWNYLLIWYDGSKGVHNPRFTRNVLISTIEAISK